MLFDVTSFEALKDLTGGCCFDRKEVLALYADHKWADLLNFQDGVPSTISEAAAKSKHAVVWCKTAEHIANTWKSRSSSCIKVLKACGSHPDQLALTTSCGSRPVLMITGMAMQLLEANMDLETGELLMGKHTGASVFAADQNVFDEIVLLPDGTQITNKKVVGNMDDAPEVKVFSFAHQLGVKPMSDLIIQHKRENPNAQLDMVEVIAMFLSPKNLHIELGEWNAAGMEERLTDDQQAELLAAVYPCRPISDVQITSKDMPALQPRIKKVNGRTYVYKPDKRAQEQQLADIEIINDAIAASSWY